MLKDGAKAWEIKDFLVKQDRCEVVSIDNQDYPGKGAKSKVSNEWISKTSPKLIIVCCSLIIGCFVSIN